MALPNPFRRSDLRRAFEAGVEAGKVERKFLLEDYAKYQAFRQGFNRATEKEE